MSDEEPDSPSSKRVPRKKHYPFGTPSHSHHPYSAFKHLNVDNVSFAVDLATATGIEPEIVVTEVKKKFRKPPKSMVPAGVLGGEVVSLFCLWLLTYALHTVLKSSTSCCG